MQKTFYNIRYNISYLFVIQFIIKQTDTELIVIIYNKRIRKVIILRVYFYYF